MKKNDLVTIILPVYNSEKTISATIDSVLMQTYQNFELIIINDGSTDSSDEIIKSKENINDKIIYIKNSNHGVSYSRNFAINKAKGKYLTFIDSDDKYTSDYIETLLNKMNEGYDLVTCGYQNFEKSSKIFIPKNQKYFSKTSYLEILQEESLFNQIWNKMYSVNIIKSNRIYFDEKLSIAEDWNFNLEYLSKINNFTTFNKVLYKYRISKSGLGFKYRKDANKIKLDLIKKTDKLFFNDISSKYVSENYIKQYFAYFSNIIDLRNKETLKQKKEKIKKIINSEEFKNIISNCKSYSFKHKILLFCLSKGNITFIIFMSFLANFYDKFHKSIKYGI